MKDLKYTILKTGEYIYWLNGETAIEDGSIAASGVAMLAAIEASQVKAEPLVTSEIASRVA